MGWWLPIFGQKPSAWPAKAYDCSALKRTPGSLHPHKQEVGRGIHTAPKKTTSSVLMARRQPWRKTDMEEPSTGHGQRLWEQWARVDLNLGVLAGTSAAILYSEDMGRRALRKREGVTTKPALDCLSLVVTERSTK